MPLAVILYLIAVVGIVGIGMFIAWTIREHYKGTL